MRRILIFFCGILFVSFSAVLAQQNAKDKPKEVPAADPAPAAIPAEAKAKENPVKPTPEGLASVNKLFGYHCAMCHGKDGDGKGDLAISMKLDLKDWRDANSLAKMTDGEMFYIVTNGRGRMTGGEGDRTKEEVRWNLVNLVRSFSKKAE